VTAAASKLASKAGPEGDVVSEVRDLILDLDHLVRMTLGDHALEREVLEIFVRQSAMMLGCIVDAGPVRLAEVAHTMSGSARGIGAWRVARAAERLERASGEACQDTLSRAIADLQTASLEAGAAIAARLESAPLALPETSL
jgi:HPt (histidine-containing phosphotransfer) domain-containing protein